MKRQLAALTTALIAGGTILMDRVHAAEGAIGFYLLGSATTNAGIVPPPGTYLIDYNYYYSGSTDFNLNIAGLDVSGGVDADAYYNIMVICPTG